MVVEALLLASTKGQESDDPSASHLDLVEISRLLAALPNDLLRIEVSAMSSKNKLGLEGRHGKVKADWTYNLSPVVKFTRRAMHLWMVAKQTSQEPSENNGRFTGFLIALWPADLPNSEKQDWDRAIRVARAKDQTEGRTAAHFIARFWAESTVLPLTEAIRAQRGGAFKGPAISPTFLVNAIQRKKVD